MKNQPDNENLAAETDYSGEAFQADAAMAPDTNSLVGVPGSGNADGGDDVLKPSIQTDYRSVDNGRTSIGATDTNADQAPLGGLSTPGVRYDNDLPGIQTGGVSAQGSDVLSGGDDRDTKTNGDVLNDRSSLSGGLGSSPADVSTLGSSNSSVGISSGNDTPKSF
ncbi:MAG TPA: hypothetical protein VF627_13880 [Abditibacterium sp.]|jgi:hypothetical protein